MAIHGHDKFLGSSAAPAPGLRSLDRGVSLRLPLLQGQVLTLETWAKQAK